MKQSGIRSVW